MLKFDFKSYTKDWISEKDYLEEYKNKVAELEHQLKAQQTPSNLVNYGTVNIYEK